jgi:hypothetical protein
MAKKGQIEKAIEELLERKRAIEAKAANEVAGLMAAVDALEKQKRKAPKPRAVKTPGLMAAQA